MKKTSWILLGLLIVLAAVAYFSKGEKKNYLEGDQLAVKNTDIIHKVFIADRHKKRITLTKSEDGWMVNDTYRARDGAIKTLLETLEGVRVQSFVAKAAQKNVIQEIRDFGIKVELYNKADKIFKVLYVGGAANNQIGSYVMQEGDNNIYIARIRNWEGVLQPRFMLEVVEWRDKSIFRYDPNSIQEVILEYPANPQSSFKLEKQGKNKYEVYPLAIEQDFVKDRPQIIQGKALYYLKGFERQIAEAFENNNPKRDSVLQTVPFVIINVKDSEGQSKEVKLFPIPGKIRGTNPDGTPRRSPVERYFASVNDNEEFMLVQHLLFKRLFAPYSFFFSEDDQNE